MTTRDELTTLKHELTLTPLVCPAQATPVVTWLDGDRRNGGAHLAGFHCGRHPLFDPLADAGRLAEVEMLLPHPTIRDTLPETFEVTDPLTYTHGRLRGWRAGLSLEVPGQWARELYTGSFYTSPHEQQLSIAERDRRAEHALTVAQNLYYTLFGQHYATVDVYTTPDPWCRWFRGMCNLTWILFDHHQRHLWLLATTDQD